MSGSENDRDSIYAGPNDGDSGPTEQSVGGDMGPMDDPSDAYAELHRKAESIRLNVARTLATEVEAEAETIDTNEVATNGDSGGPNRAFSGKFGRMNADEVLAHRRARSEMIFQLPGSFVRPTQPLVPMLRLPGWVPHVVAAFAVMVLFWIFSITILRDFRNMFEEFELDLPAITRLLLGLGDLVSTHGFWLIPLATIALAATLFFASTWLVSVFPSMGNGRTSQQYQEDADLATSIANWSMHWRDFDSASESAPSGGREFPLLMELAADSIPAGQAERVRYFLRHWVNGGCGPSAAGVMTDLPPTLMQCGLDVFGDHATNGEGRQSTLDEVDRRSAAERLVQLASLYLYRQQVFRSRSMAAYWGPVWIIFAGLMIGVVVVALFAPLVSLVTGLS